MKANKRFKTIVLLVLTLSVIGLIDASYLTNAHYTGAELSCGLSGGCDTVTTSKYSEIFGIPVSLLGLVFYLVVFVSSLFYLDRGKEKVLNVVKWLSPFAFLASAWFVYTQLFILHAICQYCMVSAGVSTLIFLSSLFFYKKDNS